MRKLGVLLLCLIALPICGFDQPPVSIEELAQKADLVVHGKVESVVIERDIEGRIFTSVKISIEEALKGKPRGPLLTVVHSGGALGDRRVVTGGQVSYLVGEEIVGFYLWNDRGEATTLALAQGKFLVRRTKQTVGIMNRGSLMSFSNLKNTIRGAAK